METGKTNHEQISMLADGELEDEDVNPALQALRDPAQQATWALYHQIGDAIRSDELAAPLSADFSARMAARLEAEPTLLAPRATTPAPAPGLLRRLSHSSGAWAAVAAAALAFVLAPQMLPSHQTTQQATQLGQASSSLREAPPAAMLAEATQSGKLEVPVKRSAEMDEYILAHQSSYPSLYGSAQLARPANLHEESAR
jgi:sigma-E factor negative regulatory protein RseA